MTQLFNLMVQVMLPLGLLVAAGAFWPRFFAASRPGPSFTRRSHHSRRSISPAQSFSISAIAGAAIPASFRICWKVSRGTFRNLSMPA